MNLALFLYLTDVLSNADNILSIVLLVYFLAIAVGLFMFAFTSDTSWQKEEHDAARCYLKRLASYKYIAIAAVLMLIAIPNQRTMYLMLGSAYLSESGLPAKVTEALNIKLDDVIKELKEKKKDE